MLENTETTPARVRPITWVGLFVALFGMLLVRQVVSFVWGDSTVLSAIIKEAGMWLVGAVLIVIIMRGEDLPLSSIGLTAARLGRSILRALLIAIICFSVAAVVVMVTHFNGGAAGKALEKLPVWLVFGIVVRAGIVEELCYRGYAIERLHALGLPRTVAAAVPLAIFGVGHWTGGWANIVLALALGAVLAVAYLWRRDLVANMTAHFLVDFVPNVLTKLFS